MPSYNQGTTNESQLIVIPTKPSVQHTEQAINQVIMLKQFVNSVKPIYEALAGARSAILNQIREVSKAGVFGCVRI